MKLKKILAGVTSLVLAGSMAACGSSEVTAPTDGGDAPAATAAPADNGGNGGGETAAETEELPVGDATVQVSAEGVKTKEEIQKELKEIYGDKEITLTVFSQLANYSGESIGWFAELMKREFNVKLTIIPNTDGMFDTRMESGNLGDIVIFGSDGDDYTRAVNEGMLYNWYDDELLDEFGPYVKANMPYALKKNVNLNKSINGKEALYGFGHNVASDTKDHQAFFYTMDVRWDLYKQLGYPEVKTLDDFYNLMVQMKDICPTDDNGAETYAVSLWPDWDGDMVMYVKSFATCYWGYEGDQGLGHYDVENGDFYYALDDGSPYLRSLKFFNRLYQAGLIDPDSMTQTYNEMSEKVKAGGTFFSIFDYAGSAIYNDAEHLEAGKGMFPMIPGDATPIVYGMNVLGGNRLWTIGANTEYPELCMAIINYLSTPEGYLSYWYGPKDLCWYYDENGHTCLTELGESANKDRKGTMMPDEWGGGTFNDGTFQANNTTWSRDCPNPESNGDTYNCENWITRQESMNYDIVFDWRKKVNAETVQEYMDTTNYKLALGTSYTMGSQSAELKVLWKQVTECVKNYSWQAIYAKDDAEFDKVVAEMVKKCSEYDPQGECKAFSVAEAQRRHELEEQIRNGG